MRRRVLAAVLGAALALARAAAGGGSASDEAAVPAAPAEPASRSATWVRPDACAPPEAAALEAAAPGPAGPGRTIAARAERPPCRLSAPAAERNAALLEGGVWVDVTAPPPPRRRGR